MLKQQRADRRAGKYQEWSAGRVSVRVLVIDDDLLQVRHLIRLPLEKEGCVVGAAMNGAHALQLAVERPPALTRLEPPRRDRSYRCGLASRRVAGSAGSGDHSHRSAAEKAGSLGAFAYLHNHSTSVVWSHSCGAASARTGDMPDYDRCSGEHCQGDAQVHLSHC
jgi:hypothetical protein